MPEVSISKLSWGGQGIGRIDGKVVFVPFVLPGEVVDIELVHSKKNYSLGNLIRILEPSPDRIEPPCSFYPACGGCQLQHLAPHKQVQQKEQLFRQAMEHTLKTKDLNLEPTLISPSAYGYRHRLHLKTIFKNNRLDIGFFGAKSHDLVPVDHCLLANGVVNETLGVLKEKIRTLGYDQWSPEIDLQGFDRPRERGIVFSSPKKLPRSQRKKITEALFADLDLKYLLFRGPNPISLSGEHPFIPEEDSPGFSLPASETGLQQDLRITCFPLVFTQVNLELNRLLMAHLLKQDLFTSRDTILDLYCGLGNFTLPAALQAREVVGLEAFPLAVANARWNQKINRISNCSFIQTKAEAGVRQSHLRHLPISLVILDPPRSGAREIIPWLDAWDLKKILYFSCDPMTLFRDLSMLAAGGWKVEWSKSIDFFPQTFHLESVTFLKK